MRHAIAYFLILVLVIGIAMSIAKIHRNRPTVKFRRRVALEREASRAAQRKRVSDL